MNSSGFKFFYIARFEKCNANIFSKVLSEFVYLMNIRSNREIYSRLGLHFERVIDSFDSIESAIFPLIAFRILS